MTNKISIKFLAAVLFAILSGFIGSLISKYYYFDSLGLPANGEYAFNQRTEGNPNIIIRDAKKVVIEQEDRLAEIISLISKSQTDIYAKADKKKIDELFLSQEQATSSYYFEPEDRAGEGLILTNDGWVNLKFYEKKYKTGNLLDLTADFMIKIDNKFFTINKYFYDNITDSYFAKIAVIDLSVIKLGVLKDRKNGENIFSFDSRGAISKNSILSLNRIYNNIKGDSNMTEGIILENSSEDADYFYFYNLQGDLICVMNQQKCLPIDYITSALESISKTGKISRAFLDIEYQDLSVLSIVDDKDKILPKTGILVLSAPKINKKIQNDKTLLKGDIIMKIDDNEVDGSTTLPEMLLKYRSGAIVNFMLDRQGKEVNLEYSLDK
jgi:hypothetical protein